MENGFFLSNAHTLQTQLDRLAEHHARFTARCAVKEHRKSCQQEQALHPAFFDRYSVQIITLSFRRRLDYTREVNES